MSFSSLSLPSFLLEVLNAKKFSEPTEVQAQVIPAFAEKRDLLVEAQTGTGKTAAFALPLIQKAMVEWDSDSSQKVRSLVLVPTRELAHQVTEVFRDFSSSTPRQLHITTIVGGENKEIQTKGLARGGEVTIATPGRLLEMLQANEISLIDLEILILDEADKLLTLGFQEDIHHILSYCPPERQNLLFSATLPPKVLSLSKSVCGPSVHHISFESEERTVKGIAQRVIEVNRDMRRPLLQHMLKSEAWSQVIIFVASKKAARNLCAKLNRDGFEADALHGDLIQEDRTAVLKDFKKREFSILVATDLASRGIDVDDLSCVINYDLPRSPMDYIHRVGRTGRAGKQGVAISFIDFEDFAHFKLIEKRARIRLEREQIPNFELQGEAPVKTKGPAPVKGKRKSKKDKLRELAAKKNLEGEN
jgi:superfamily II DNA/RNA helicase